MSKSSVVTELKPQTGEVVNFNEKKKKIKGKEIKLKKDGTPKNTPCNSIKGDPHEVYSIKDKEMVKAFGNYFKNKEEEAERPEWKQIAARNYLMWVVGINVGLRASDLRDLTWGDVFNDDNTFQDGIRIQEKKTGKFKTFFFNKHAMEAITEYVNKYEPYISKDTHVFRSREGGAIEVRTICGIIKEAAEACGFNKNTGSHTLRKTFGYHWYMGHQNDVNALTHLQRLFSHSSPQVTLAYIGIEDEESKKYYNDLTWD